MKRKIYKPLPSGFVCVCCHYTVHGVSAHHCLSKGVSWCVDHHRIWLRLPGPLQMSPVTDIDGCGNRCWFSKAFAAIADTLALARICTLFSWSRGGTGAASPSTIIVGSSSRIPVCQSLYTKCNVCGWHWMCIPCRRVSKVKPWLLKAFVHLFIVYRYCNWEFRTAFQAQSSTHASFHSIWHDVCFLVDCRVRDAHNKAYGYSLLGTKNDIPTSFGSQRRLMSFNNALE